jgi:hypothetical protein
VKVDGEEEQAANYEPSEVIEMEMCALLKVSVGEIKKLRTTRKFSRPIALTSLEQTQKVATEEFRPVAPNPNKLLTNTPR